MKKRLVAWMAVAFVATMTALPLCAADRVWTGGGDGLRWNDADNWGGAVPSTGDNVQITSGASPLVVSNDIAGLTIATLTISGSSAVTVQGEEITLTEGSASAFVNSVAAVIDASLCFSTARGGVDPSASVTFNGTVRSTSSSYLCVNGRGSTIIRFNAPITGPTTGTSSILWFNPQSNYVKVYSYGKIDLRRFWAAGDNYCAWHFMAQGNKMPSGIDNQHQNIFFDIENALDESSPIMFTSGYKNSTFHMGGSPQVANRISSGKPSGDDWAYRFVITADSDPASLTLKATEDASTYAILEGPLSLVYDPQGGYTQTFLDRAHTTTGSITVKGGTLRMDGTTSFAFVPSVTVESGTFDVATTNTGALASVSSLSLGASARFAVAATAESLFGSSATFAHVRASSRFVIPSGATLRVGSLVVDGVPVAPDSYTQTGDGARKTLAQVEGDGTLIVDSYPSGTCWTGAADGDFNNAANWTAGVPSATDDGHVEKIGDVGVSLSAAPASTLKGLSLANESGTTTLDVTAPVSLAGGKVSVGRNAEISVGASGAWAHDFTGAAASASDETFGLHNGGKFTVGGGQVSFVNAAGRLNIGGLFGGDTGTLEISSGTCTVSKTSGDYLCLNRHGTLKMTGGLLEIGNAEDFNQYGGLIDLSGDATIRSATASDSLAVMLKNVTLRMRGNSCFTNTNTVATRLLSFQPNNAGETCLVDMDDNAYMHLRNTRFFIGRNCAGGRTMLKMRGNSALNAASTVDIGFGNGADGELDIGENARFYYDAYAYGIFIGRYSTSADSPAKGVLRMSGGSIVNGKGPNGGDTAFDGIIVGYDDSGTYSSAVVKGFVYMSGGAITNKIHVIAIGVCSAEGTVEQSGGTIRQDVNFPVLVGYRGGKGSYVMTGGMFTSKNNSDAYVGGGQLDYLSTTPNKPAYGTLSVMGGTFSVGRSLYVSGGGYGVLEIGPTGSVTVAQNVYLTNSVDAVKSVTAPAKLRFVLGAEGCGALTVGGTCKVSADAELEIDVSDYAGEGAVTLVSGTMEGSFADGNVTITGAAPRRQFKLTQTGGGIRLQPYAPGMMMIVR